MKKSFTIPNPLYSIYFTLLKLHTCNYTIKLHDIHMENDTNILITTCKCGKSNIIRVHRESITYKNWIKDNENIKFI